MSDSKPEFSFVNKNKKNKNNNKISNDIIFEYSLNRGKFNPIKNSPNYFCNKLELRMKTYYNYLYSLSSSPPTH